MVTIIIIIIIAIMIIFFLQKLNQQFLHQTNSPRPLASLLMHNHMFLLSKAQQELPLQVFLLCLYKFKSDNTILRLLLVVQTGLLSRILLRLLLPLTDTLILRKPLQVMLLFHLDHLLQLFNKELTIPVLPLSFFLPTLQSFLPPLHSF